MMQCGEISRWIEVVCGPVSSGKSEELISVRARECAPARADLQAGHRPALRTDTSSPRGSRIHSSALSNAADVEAKLDLALRSCGMMKRSSW